MPTQQSIHDMALLRLFGHPVLESDGTRTALKVPAKAVALLAIVVANHMRPLSREWLAQTLWPDSDPAEARTNLRRHLHLCSRAIGEDAFMLTRTTVQWNVDSETDVDVIRFDAFSQTHPALAIQEYSGEFCAGEADETLETFRIRYRSAYESLLRGLIAGARAAKDDAQLAVWLQRALNHDPFDEEAVRQIMELRMRHGDRAGAIREYNAFSQRLRSELASEPDAQTNALFQEIAGATEPVKAPNNLPNASTTFVGRENDLAVLADALRRSRIVTLVGPGGIGKSRLALRAAHNLLPEYSGAWLVSLEHATSEAAIWEQTAHTLNLPATSAPRNAVLTALQESQALILFDTCEHAAESASRAAEWLTQNTSVTLLATSRRKLNAHGEHVLHVSPLELPPADLAGAERMRFAAYRLFVERATTVNAAFRVEPRDRRALSDVLTRTDGLPLAIELVASRANVLTIEGMRKHLPAAMRAGHRTATSRARTIDDTIAWSYGLLSDVQKRVFRWLGAFQGTFEIDDAERVCPDNCDVATCMFELVDASLLSVASGGAEIRYHFLETTRAYARRLLLDCEGTDALLRHAEYFARRAEALAQAPDSALSSLLESLRNAIADYLAALDYAFDTNAFGIGQLLLEGLHRFGMGNHFSRELLERAERLANAAPRDAVGARIARLCGMLAESCGEYALSTAQFEIALAYYREHNDETNLCDALSGLAIMAYHLGRYDECMQGFSEVLARTERSGDAKLHTKTLGRMGALYLSQGQFEKSIPLLETAVRELRALGEFRQCAYALKNLGTAAHYAGRHREAIEWLDQALDLTDLTKEIGLHTMALCVRGSAYRELADGINAVDTFVQASEFFPALAQGIDLAECLEDVASTLCWFGLHEPAAKLAGFCNAVHDNAGSPINPGLRKYYDRTNAQLEQFFGTRLQAYYAAGAEQTSEEACRLATGALEQVRARLCEQAAG